MLERIYTDDSMKIDKVSGDLLDQEVEVIVNAWNRNFIPWWLLLPQGVSAAIKKRAGVSPFQELRKFGVLPLGGAVVTGAGRLPYKAIIHVAGIGYNWRSSPKSIKQSIRSAVAVAQENGYRSLAIPLIGAGTGGGSPDEVEKIIFEELQELKYEGRVVLVRYAPSL